MTLSIGDLHLQSNVFLSPMEGVSDVGFRNLCYRNGAGITWTEMIRASGIVRKNKATLDLIDTHDPETLTGVQLFVVNERELGVALYTLEQLSVKTLPHLKNIRAIDLNFGCPSPEVIRVGAGPALLKRTQKMGLLFKVLHDWRRRTSLDIGAVGVKIRLGMNPLEQEHKIYLRLMDAANANLDYITVHARNAKQKSSDPPSWNAIGEMKDIASIPVIGNGDVIDATSMQRMISQTKCDGVMIARAAIQNPWIFRELAGRGNAIPSPAEIDAAQTRYTEFAARWQLKEKFTQFHAMNFERMRRDLNERFVPKNAHI